MGKLKRVYLLNPPVYNQKDRLVREGRCMQRESSWSNLWMPLTLCILKPLIKNNLKIESKVRDAVADRFTMDDVIDEIKNFKPDVIIINTAVPSITNEDLDTAMNIKKFNSKIFTVMIGVPATVMTDIIFKDPRGRYVDVCVHHESELPILDLLKKLNRGKNWKMNNGVAYVSKNKIIYNRPYDPVNLDLLPDADYSDLDLENYTLPFSREPVAMVETARGCPNKCTFCVGKEYYFGKFRFRSYIKIADEIECLYNKGVKNFLFWADSWTAGGKLAEQLCDEIIRRNLKISFLCNGRVDVAYPALFEKMKKAGCRVLAFGVESCDQNILNNIKKNIIVEQIERAIKTAKKAGLSVSAHVVVGLSGETWESVKDTTRKLIKYDPDYINVYVPVPYPGTEMYDEARRKGWIKTDDFNMYEELHSVMRNESMSTEDMQLAKKYMIRKFYFRPRVILRELSRVFQYDNKIRYLYYLFFDSVYFLKGWVFGGKHS